jgi:signal recognition particle subunit SRP54
MFDSLTDKLEQTVKRLRGHGRITEKNVEDAVREVRLALLEADVHFQVVRDFTERVRAKSLGQDVLASLTPEQHFIKIVREELTQLMGNQAVALDLAAPPPVGIMLVGLQGTGKTTTAAKLAHHLRSQNKRRPYLVPADVYRPAAIEQLTALGRQIEVPVHPTHEGANPVDVCREARAAAAAAGADVVIFDTAGRLHLDDELMAELERIRSAVEPHQIVLVVDAMTGQDAVNAATGFSGRLPLGGVIMTKLDGDARGGAALSVREVTGAPILFAGVGEKLDALEAFHPDRMATRILGMGDVLTLIERAEQVYDEKEALKLERKLRRNEFTLEDFRDQLRAVRRMGAVGDLLAMIPGMKKLTKGVDMAEAETQLRRTEAIINSMTNEERANAALLNGSRRRRIAAGSGTSVADVNRFLKQFQQTKKAMKQMTRHAGKGMRPGFGG